MPAKRLFRKQNDCIVAGVCSGLAEYFAVDTTVVRLAAAAFVVLTGFFPGVVLYIIAIFLIPIEPMPTASTEVPPGQTTSNDAPPPQS